MSSKKVERQFLGILGGSFEKGQSAAKMVERRCTYLFRIEGLVSEQPNGAA
jgi:hypothetical protein